MSSSSSRLPGLAAAIAFALGMLLWSMPAHAYLDPATGSILLQGALAGVAGLMVVVRLYWRRLKAFFRSLRGAGASVEPTETTASQESK